MASPAEFITERRYLRTSRRKPWLGTRTLFALLERALDDGVTIVARIAELRQRGVSAVSVNTYLHCINAYLRWLHLEHKHELVRLPRLKEEQKVLATFSLQHVEDLSHHRPNGANAARAWMASRLSIEPVAECLRILVANVDRRLIVPIEIESANCWPHENNVGVCRMMTPFR